MSESQAYNKTTEINVRDVAGKKQHGRHATLDPVQPDDVRSDAARAGKFTSQLFPALIRQQPLTFRLPNQASDAARPAKPSGMPERESDDDSQGGSDGPDDGRLCEQQCRSTHRQPNRNECNVALAATSADINVQGWIAGR